MDLRVIVDSPNNDKYQTTDNKILKWLLTAFFDTDFNTMTIQADIL